MEFWIYVLAAIAIIMVAWSLLKEKSTKENGGKIASKYATFDDVKNHLECFIPKTDSKLKNGYTEKSIENQLVKFMKQKFVEVTPQYGIEGRNARAIDVDVANGVAGIELKDAKKVVKTAEMDRVKSQILAYQEKRYQECLILLVVGDSEDKNDSCLIELKDYCRKNKVKYYYFELDKGLVV
ncbi:MAG: hypothetical protein K6G25_10300 [Bacteroidales bacterium]|nr:hypothetical protein [Bacteroidales bacterium]